MTQYSAIHGVIRVDYENSTQAEHDAAIYASISDDPDDLDNLARWASQQRLDIE